MGDAGSESGKDEAVVDSGDVTLTRDSREATVWDDGRRTRCHRGARSEPAKGAMGVVCILLLAAVIAMAMLLMPSPGDAGQLPVEVGSFPKVCCSGIDSDWRRRALIGGR